MSSRSLTIVYRCDRTFDELEGNDALQRRCSRCRLDVVDFRAFTEEQQRRYLELAEIGQEELCAVVVESGEARPCTEHPDSIQRAPRDHAANGRSR